MKIYLSSDKNLLNKENIDKIVEKLKILNSNKYIEFYSNEGIFKQEINNLYKLYPVDKSIIKNNYIISNKNYIFLFDNSFFEKNIVYSLPNKFIQKNVEEKKYKLNTESLVQLVLIYENNSFTYFFFEIPDNYKNKIDENYFYLEFSSFLSILKNI